jgi:3-hydroxymyristoyl/3-hydroxydecanoyl-(acyl carrier protein) dehydratase
MGCRSTFQVPAQHPAFDGHFPGAPLLPGVLLLDEALHAAALTPSQWRITTAKFRQPVHPGEILTVELDDPAPNGAVHFTLHGVSGVVADGTFAPRSGPVDAAP